jgi:quercetin dioxygenase-like cupin family protein
MKVQAIETHTQQAMPMEGASGVKMRMLVGPAEGATKFHMRQFEVEPGGHTPHHSHDYEHEILILAGRGTAVSEQGERALCAGDVVWIPPNERHQFRNMGDETFKFICLIPAPMDCSK